MRVGRRASLALLAAALLAAATATPAIERGHDHEKLLRVLAVGPGDVVADIGCGAGGIAAAVARAVAPGGLVYAVDIDRAQIELTARRGAPNLVAILSQPDDVSLPDSIVDVAFLHDVATHVDEKARPGFYASIAQALVPGGRLVLFLHHGRAADHLDELEGYGFRAVERAELLGLTETELDQRCKRGIVLRDRRFDEAIEEARTVVASLRRLARIPGISAAVAVDGRVVWSEGFGSARLEPSVAARADTLYRLGSVSKLLTAAALGRLVERGELDLDAPVQRYAPSFPEQEHAITPRMLAGHLAGIRHYLPRDFAAGIDARHFESLTDGLAIFAGDPLLHAPGTQYRYTSFGFNLLGVALEGASERDFVTLVREEVLTPIGMPATRPDRAGESIEGRGGMYELRAGAPVPSPAVDPSYKWPSGGYLSTVRDLARFGAAHTTQGYLSDETRELLFASQYTAAGEPTGVGLGWRVGRDDNELRYVHHGGSMEGCRAFLLVHPDDGVAVALLCNLKGAAFAQEEALLIAETFVMQRGGVETPQAPPERAGTYELRSEGAAFATLVLEQSGTGWSGTFTNQGMLAPVIAARMIGSQMRVLVEHRSGALLVVRLEQDGGRYWGRLTLPGQESTAIEAARVE